MKMTKEKTFTVASHREWQANQPRHKSLGTDEQIAKLLRMNGAALSDKALNDAVAYVKQLTNDSLSELRELRDLSPEEITQKVSQNLSTMSRPAKEHLMTNLLSLYHTVLDGKENDTFGKLELPDHTLKSSNPDKCKKTIRNLTDDSLDAKIITLVSSAAAFVASEKDKNPEVSESIYNSADLDKIKRYRFAVASLLNMKQTGKLSEEFAAMDDKTLAAAACLAVDYDDICAKKGCPQFHPLHILLATSILLIAVCCIIVNPLSIIALLYPLWLAFQVFETELMPGGFTETEFAQHIIEKSHRLSAKLKGADCSAPVQEDVRPNVVVECGETANEDLCHSNLEYA